MSSRKGSGKKITKNPKEPKVSRRVKVLIFIGTGILTLLGGVVRTILSDTAEQVAPSAVKIIKYPVQFVFGHGPDAHQVSQPVLVDSVTVQRNEELQGNTYIFPQPLSVGSGTLSHLASGGYTDAMNTWARKNGGVDPSWAFIQIIVSGNRDHTVRIIGMQVQGTCSSPLRGTVMDSPPAGADYSQYIGFDLDKGDIDARTYTPTGKFGDGYFLSKTISLKNGEQQTLEVVGKSFTHYCQFAINLIVLDGQEKVTEVIRNGNQPFKVSGILPLRDYEVAYTGGVCSGTAGWVKPNPRPANC